MIKEGSEYLAFLFDTSYYDDEPFKRLGNVADYWLGYSDSLCFEKVGDHYLGSEYLSSFKGARVLLDTLGIASTDDFELLKGSQATFSLAAQQLTQSVHSDREATRQFLYGKVCDASAKQGISQPFLMLDIAVERMENGRYMYVISCESLESGIRAQALRYWGTK